MRAAMKFTITLALALSATAAFADPLPVPRVGGPGGGCPVGYSWQGSYCIPLSNDIPAAIPKKGTTCPSGWTAIGSYCIKQ
jgi:hypothetical protein